LKNVRQLRTDAKKTLKKTAKVSPIRSRLKKDSGRGPPGSDVGVGSRGCQLVRLGEHRIDLLERRLARFEHADHRLRGQAAEDQPAQRRPAGHLAHEPVGVMVARVLERPPYVLALVHGRREQRNRQSGQELPAPSVS
jgi:hypothetical protein